MNSYILQSILAIMVSAVICSAAEKRVSPAEKTTLSSHELQELLEISSWRVRIPESFGSSPVLLLELYKNGKRIDVHHVSLAGPIELEPSRLCLITLREENGKHFYTCNSLRSGAVKLTESPASAPSYLNSSPEISASDVVLFKRIYLGKGADLTSLESMSKNNAGTVLFRIAKDTTPLAQN